MKFYLWVQNKKSIKLYKSLGGRIAHLEVPSSRKISIPPFWLLARNWNQWGTDNIISRLSMQGIFTSLNNVAVNWISHSVNFRFLVLYDFLSWWGNTPPSIQLNIFSGWNDFIMKRHFWPFPSSLQQIWIISWRLNTSRGLTGSLPLPPLKKLQ